MALVYVLYEHATGFVLFQVNEFEEIAAHENEVEKSVMDLSRFNAMVKMVAFQQFADQQNALENCNAVADGILTDTLKLFLEQNLPDKKRKKMTLGVGDAKLGAAIQEAFEVSTQSFGVIPEILRGIRVHVDKLVKGFVPAVSGKAQVGLAHSFCRAKVKFNVHRQDQMIIQSISVLDQLDKDINTFCMRIKEWYSYHFPELARIAPENHMYAKLVHAVGDRAQITDDKIQTLQELLQDEAKVQEIVDAAKSSMGMDISELDLLNIELFSTRVSRLVDYRKMQQEYLHSKMTTIAPNLSSLIGDQVGARLICNAGSLTNLAKYPASTVQILGAEKALFRALKTKGNTPKYGLIFHSSFIGQAKAKDKGRISRFLANKCSIASRIDCFSDIPTSVFGQHMHEQVKARLTFLTTGEKPQKNADVMKHAIAEADVARAVTIKAERKRLRKLKKQEQADGGGGENDAADETMNTSSGGALDTSHGEPSTPVGTTTSSNANETPTSKKSKKRKSQKAGDDDEEAVNGNVAVDGQAVAAVQNSQSQSGKKRDKKQSLVQVDI